MTENNDVLTDAEKETLDYMRDIANSLGYESVLEALEALDRLKSRPTASADVQELLEALEKQGHALAAFVNLLEPVGVEASDGECLSTGEMEWQRRPTHDEVQIALAAQNIAADTLAKVRDQSRASEVE